MILRPRQREMIEGAIGKGLEMICFTDHYDKDDVEWGPESIFDPQEYFRVLKPLKEKYQDKIDVRIGVELGLRPYLGTITGSLWKPIHLNSLSAPCTASSLRTRHPETVPGQDG